MSVLGEALFTATQRNVLGLLYGQTGRSFYLKEILRLTGMGVATIKRELDRMEHAGIITLTRIGNQNHYQANPDCQIYHELISIVAKTFGIADVVRDALKPIYREIHTAFIYGSIAKGREKPGSDLDLMLVGTKLSYTEVMDCLLPVSQAINREINPVIYTPEEFESRRKDRQHFIGKVMKQDNIMIKESMDDIGQSG